MCILLYLRRKFTILFLIKDLKTILSNIYFKARSAEGNLYNYFFFYWLFLWYRTEPYKMNKSQWTDYKGNHRSRKQ